MIPDKANVLAIQVGTWMLGIAVMLLGGMTIYDWASDRGIFHAAALVIAIICGIVTGGALAYALQQVCFQLLGYQKPPK